MACEFIGKMKNGKSFHCKMKDIGRNNKRSWYSARFTLRVRHQLPVVFYSRVDCDLCDLGNAHEIRLSEDMARLESKGIDISTMKFIS